MGVLNSGPVEERRRSALAHVLRRTTFGPFPGQVEQALTEYGTPDVLIEALLDRSRPPWAPTLEDPSLPGDGVVDPDHLPPDSDLRYYLSFRRWWAQRMMNDDAGLHDKMMWFWHTHFTSSFIKVDSTEMCWDQMRLLHRHAMGNFGELAKAMVLDRAMLRYLDGDGSSPSAPNENFAREFMELFTLGVGRYRQSDVVAAARVFSGWYIDEQSRLRRQPGASLPDRVDFLGVDRRFDVDGIVDEVLKQDSCAPFVVAKLWQFFIGGPPPKRAVREVAQIFRSSGYEIAPTVAAMLRRDEFGHARFRRARTPVEWYSAVMRAGGATLPDPKALSELGQTPFGPPSPAGWPGDWAWLSPTQAHARAMLLQQADFPVAEELAQQADLVRAVRNQCSMWEMPAKELEVLLSLADGMDESGVDPVVRASSVLSAAFMTPTFCLA